MGSFIIFMVFSIGVIALYLYPAIKIMRLEAAPVFRTITALFSLSILPVFALSLQSVSFYAAPETTNPKLWEAWSNSQMDISIGIALVVTWSFYWAVKWHATSNKSLKVAP